MYYNRINQLERRTPILALLESPSSHHKKMDEEETKYRSLEDSEEVQVTIQDHTQLLDYGYDLVLVFPREENAEMKRPDDFSLTSFLNLMLGLRISKSKGNQLIQDEIRTVLKSARCFLDDDGMETHVPLSSNCRMSRSSIHDEAKKAETLAYQKRVLTSEYAQYVGHTNDITQSEFCELVATSVARRLQVACGLTTRMFRSIDNDEIIVTIKADDMDLRVEADRTDYRLQTSNMPFAPIHDERNNRIKQEIGNEKFEEAKEHLRNNRLGNEDTLNPEMDPLLMSHGEKYHPKADLSLKAWGHNEFCDGDFHLRSPDYTPAKRSFGQGLKNALIYIAEDPFTYFSAYAAYKLDDKYQPYYRRYPLAWNGTKEETLFSQVDRIRLSTSIIQRHLGVDALEESGYLVGNLFALHDQDAMDYFYKNWAMNFSMMTQPIAKIREYFGEKIALYFAWLEFYTKMLVLPAIFGIIMFALTETKVIEGYTRWFLFAFSSLIVVWSTLFTELWKRKNSLYNTLWGVTNMSSNRDGASHSRAQFIGELRYNPVTDLTEMWHAPTRDRMRKFLISFFVVLFMIGIVLVALVGLFTLKTKTINDEKIGDINIKPAYGISVLNAVQIIILNMVYRLVAIRLNNWENHRTDQEYEHYLIIKVFLFQFCNSFSSFFYIAFFKDKDHCVGKDCFNELKSQLAILFIIRIVVSNFFEVVVPILKFKITIFRENYAMKKNKSLSTTGSNKTLGIQYGDIAEEQAKLNPYEEMESFEDYNEMVIQYGFVTLFVAAFPLTPALALLNNILEVHVDSFKLCVGHRRPFPHVAKDIGPWFFFLRLMSFLAVMTNCALILYTTEKRVDGSDNLNNETKFLVFLVAEHVCIALQLAVDKLVRDAPLQLDLLNERFEHIEHTLFLGLVLDDNDGLVEKAEDVDLTIHDNPCWSTQPE